MRLPPTISLPLADAKRDKPCGKQLLCCLIVTTPDWKITVRRRRAAWMTLAAILVVAVTAWAQRGFGGFGGQRGIRALPNTKYDGRFTFVRINYQTAPGGYWAGGRPSWLHGYPIAEQNLMKIMNEVSYLGAHEEINTLALDDPELFR